MDKAKHDAVAKILAPIAGDKAAEKFIGYLDKIDKAITRTLKAEEAAKKARGNLSAEILTAVREAPSAQVLTEGIAAIRSTYQEGTPEYGQYNVALSRCRRAFARVTDSKNERDWQERWAEIQAAARTAPNFTQFERGEPGTAERAAAESGTAAQPGSRAPRIASIPPAPAAAVPELPREEWPELFEARYIRFEQLCAACVVDGMLAQDYVESILSLVREGMLRNMPVAGQEAAEPVEQPQPQRQSRSRPRRRTAAERATA